MYVAACIADPAAILGAPARSEGAGDPAVL